MIYRAGVCQFQPEFLKPEQNRQCMLDLAAGIKADLIVFPELATSGYTFQDRAELAEVAEDGHNGITVLLFKKLAKETNCSYVIGFPERDLPLTTHDSRLTFYNSSMLVNPDGSLHIYRKTHLFFEEKHLFTPGDTGFRVFKAKNDVPVGMMICFDWIFPESARSLMLNGAAIIAHPANLVLPWCQQAMLTRSLENRVFSVTSNRTGTEKEFTFTGMSQIVNTKGDVLLRLNDTEEKTAVTEIEIDQAYDKQITGLNELISDRRPEFYHS